MSWTEDKIETLTANWSKLSGTEIGNLVGLSRNAVIGKANRLGLPSKITEAEVQRRTTARRHKLLTCHRKTHVKPRLEPKPKPDPYLFLGLEIWGLTQATCRYPSGTGPYLFCGQPAMEKSSYCAHCHKMACEPPRMRAA